MAQPSGEPSPVPLDEDAMDWQALGEPSHVPLDEDTMDWQTLGEPSHVPLDEDTMDWQAPDCEYLDGFPDLYLDSLFCDDPSLDEILGQSPPTQNDSGSSERRDVLMKDKEEAGPSQPNEYYPLSRPYFVPKPRPNRRKPEGKGKEKEQPIQEEACILCRRSKTKCVRTGSESCKRCRRHLDANKRANWQPVCVTASFYNVVAAGSISIGLSIPQAIILNKHTYQDAQWTIRSLEEVARQTPVILQREESQIILLCLPVALPLDMWRSLVQPGLGSNALKITTTLLADVETKMIQSGPIGSLVKISAAKTLLPLNTTNQEVWVAIATVNILQQDEAYILTTEWHYPADPTARPTPCHGPNQAVDDAAASQQGNISAVPALMWLHRRYLELCLFQHLQNLANSPSLSVAEEESFVFCILGFLLRGSSGDPWWVRTSLFAISGTAKQEQCEAALKQHGVPEYMVVAYRDMLDRHKRIRDALWVYACISIDNLSKRKPWSNFWGRLPPNLRDYQRLGLQNHFQSGLPSFENKLDVQGFAGTRRPWSAPAALPLIRKAARQFGIDLRVEPTISNELMEAFQHFMVQDIFLPATLKQRYRAMYYSFPVLLSVKDEEFRLRLQGNDSWEESVDRIQEKLDLRLFSLMLFKHYITNSAKLYSEATRPDQHGNSRENPSQEVLFKIYGELFFRNKPSNVEVIGFLNQALYPDGNLTTHDIISGTYRTGERWKKVADVLGYGCVFLGLDVMGELSLPSRLDIPYIIERGTEAQFRFLQDRVLPQASWLKDVCSKLEKFVKPVHQIGDKEAVCWLLCEVIPNIFGQISAQGLVSTHDECLADSANLVQRLYEPPITPLKMEGMQRLNLELYFSIMHQGRRIRYIGDWEEEDGLFELTELIRLFVARQHQLSDPTLSP